MAWLRMALKNREITRGLKRRNISSGTECKNSKNGGPTRLELATSCVTDRRSSQLNCAPHKAEI